MTEHPVDDSQLAADIERIWHDLAEARVDSMREHEEAAARTADLAEIGATLRRYAERRQTELAERRRREARAPDA